MLVRIWTTGLKGSEVQQYERFAHEISLPMFEKQEGILGVTVLIKDNKSHVLTYWSRQEDILKMESNALYKETVAKIKSRGFLIPPQQVEVYTSPIHYSKVNIDSSQTILSRSTASYEGIRDKHLEEFVEQITFDLPEDFKM